VNIDAYVVIPAEARRPRAGIHNPKPVIMDSGLAARSQVYAGCARLPACGAPE
jgi:hypothetical protein